MINKEQTINVEAMKLLLQKQKITPLRFRLPMTEEQAYDCLLAATMAEVENRGRKFLLTQDAKSNLRQVSAFLTKDNSKFGLMLCGTCGNGKTTLIYAIQNLVNYLRKSGYYDNAHDVGVYISDAREILSKAKDLQEFNRLRNRPVLALEDIGREATEVLDYGNVLSPIIDLLEYRYNNQLYTFITTNLTAKEIREKYGTRIADRFNEMLDVVIFKNGTYRK